MDMNKVEKSAYDISALIAEIEEMLIDSMMRTMESHIKDEMLEDINWAQWQAEMLKGIEEYKQRNKGRLGDYFSLIDEKIEEAIQRAYQTGMSDLEIELLNALRGGFIPPEGGVTGGFFHPNDGKINALIDAVTNDMGKVESSILRYTDDAYRKIIYNVQMYYNMGAVSLDKAIDMATKAFLGSGISCIRYKNGAMVNIKSWAEMALRTANTRAALLGAAKKRDEYGIHLVKISSHATACPKCVPYQGNVYVDDVYGSGTAEESQQTGYPLLSSAVDGGLFHPNCRNGCSTYYEGISRPPRNTPEDVQKEQIANYEKIQYENYCNRQAEKYSRLSKYAFDKDNEQSYKARAKEWKKRALDIEDKRALNDYISSKSYILNYKLRNKEKLSASEMKTIKSIDRALEKMPLYSGNLKRTLFFNDKKEMNDFLKSYKVGAIIKNEQFISTSKMIDYNPKAQVQIYIENSTNGRDVSKINSSEQEVLYQRGSSFRIVNVVEKDNVYYILMEEFNGKRRK